MCILIAMTIIDKRQKTYLMTHLCVPLLLLVRYWLVKRYLGLACIRGNVATRKHSFPFRKEFRVSKTISRAKPRNKVHHGELSTGAQKKSAKTWKTRFAGVQILLTTASEIRPWHFILRSVSRLFYASTTFNYHSFSFASLVVIFGCGWANSKK